MAKKEAWPGTAIIKRTPWGETWDWSTHDTLQGRIIKIRGGHRTSLKFHRLRNKSFFVLHGVVEFTFGNSSTVADPVLNPYNTLKRGPGETFTVQSECPYRITALDESVLVEIGDRSQDIFVRLEDDYGRTS